MKFIKKLDAAIDNKINKPIKEQKRREAELRKKSNRREQKFVQVAIGINNVLEAFKTSRHLEDTAQYFRVATKNVKDATDMEYGEWVFRWGANQRFEVNISVAVNDNGINLNLSNAEKGYSLSVAVDNSRQCCTVLKNRLSKCILEWGHF